MDPISADLAEVRRTLAETLDFEPTNQAPLLRSTLLLFSARAASPEVSPRVRFRLIEAAVGVELLHYATQAQDERLATRAVGLLLRSLPPSLMELAARLKEARTVADFTPAFLELCCTLGAALAEVDTEALAAFGLLFGLAYQTHEENQDCPERCAYEAKRLAEAAVASISGLINTPAKRGLAALAHGLIYPEGHSF